MVITLKIYSFNNFQVDNTASLMTVTMLYTKSPKHTHLISASVYPLTSLSPFPLLPSPRQPPVYFLFLRVQLCSIAHISENIQYLVFSDLFHVAWCLQGPSMGSQMAGFLSLLWLSNIPIKISLSGHQSTGIGCFYVSAHVNDAAVSMGCRYLYKIVNCVYFG